MQTVTLFDLSIVSSSRQDVLDELATWMIDKKSCHLIGTPNPEQIMLAKKATDFQKNLLQLDCLLPDGEGVVWASRWLAQQNQGKSIAERITGIDVLDHILEYATKQNLTVLIIGGRSLASRQISLSSGLNVAIQKANLDQYSGATRDKHNRGRENRGSIFWFEGYQDVSKPTASEEQLIDRLISELQPSVVCVALGAPYQEAWLVGRRALLTKNGVRVGIIVGGAFDMLTGKTPRAPQSWQNLRLEWLWRLIHEPWRWRRQLALLSFLILVMQEYFRNDSTKP